MVGTISVVVAPMSFAGFVDTGQTAHFSDNTGTLVLAANDMFKGKIAGFGHGDLIDVLNFGTVTTRAFSAGVLTVGNSGDTWNTCILGCPSTAGLRLHWRWQGGNAGIGHI